MVTGTNIVSLLLSIALTTSIIGNFYIYNKHEYRLYRPKYLKVVETLLLLAVPAHLLMIWVTLSNLLGFGFPLHGVWLQVLWSISNVLLSLFIAVKAIEGILWWKKSREDRKEADYLILSRLWTIVFGIFTVINILASLAYLGDYLITGEVSPIGDSTPLGRYY